MSNREGQDIIQYIIPSAGFIDSHEETRRRKIVQGGISMSGVNGAFTSVGAILVLFILLVIVSRGIL